ncbi:MAG: pilus assembly protein CpaE, partial [Litoreibacter sp.]|nr:pilus assembly protein CpaE [Litoreibacter sp.]
MSNGLGIKRMTSNAALNPEPAPIVACTVARDVQKFDLLIEDMETELGEGWGDLDFTDAATFLTQPEAQDLEFIAVAVDHDDEVNLTKIGDLITRAKDTSIKVILIADDLSPIALHQLLRLGADDFVPYPLPEGALHDAIERLRKPAPPPVTIADPASPQSGSVGKHDGVILPVHGFAGGSGSTTFAVNLAWELANIEKKGTHTVCLLDLDFQFGSVSTYLDLPRREAVYE